MYCLIIDILKEDIKRESTKDDIGLILFVHVFLIGSTKAGGS